MNYGTQNENRAVQYPNAGGATLTSAEPKAPEGHVLTERIDRHLSALYDLIIRANTSVDRIVGPVPRDASAGTPNAKPHCLTAHLEQTCSTLSAFEAELQRAVYRLETFI